MAAAPRTLAADESFEDVEAFLEHLWFHLQASALTKALAPTVEKLLVGLDKCRADRRTLARALAALKAREIFADDELNWILDQVKAVLSADTSDAGVKLYKDVFDNKSPVETRKYVLGPQLTTMSNWPGMLAGSKDPKVQALGIVTQDATKAASDLLGEGGTASTALDQFDLITRASFIDSCNAAVKLLFGQLSDIELNPPPGTTMPIPPGFVDRFFLRESGSRPPTIAELEKSIERLQIKLDKQNALLKEMKAKQKKDLLDKQNAELAVKKASAAEAKKKMEEAEAELAKIQAEIDKDPPPDA
jgi:hypothetical protein